MLFQQEEERLRLLLKKSQAPVLGLLGSLLSQGARKAISDDVRATPGPVPFIYRLEQYPALFGVWLAEHVMYGLGAAGHYDVYPHIQKAMGGVPELANGDRSQLWRAFRRAILKLGIQPLPRTSGHGYMVDEYVRQAGVPLAFADDLGLKMIQQARRVGAPEEDDQDGLLSWQSALLSRLHDPSFSATARKAVQQDGQAYYARAFVRILNNHGQPAPGDALEAALAKAFQTGAGPNHIKRAGMPQLVYRDGGIGVLFPPTEKPASYEIRCGRDGATTLRLDEGGGFRALPGVLPAEVIVNNCAGERVLSSTLWRDGKSNRLLVFNAAGRLAAGAQLGQDAPVELAPGHYSVICRFTPTNTDAWEELSDEPQLVEVQVKLDPGAEVVLENGPVRVCFAGENLPSFTVAGPAKESLEGLEFRYGALAAEVRVPREWSEEAGPLGFELRVSSASTSSVLPVSLSDDGTAKVGMEVSLAKIPAGLRRVVVELARMGDARALQRQSFLFWSGLRTVSYGLRFGYAGRPLNLVAAGCTGLEFGPTEAAPVDHLARILRTAFDVGAGRVVYLSWNRPGLYIDVETIGRDGSQLRTSRRLGSSETVSVVQQKNILVSASEPGVVGLGSWELFVDFARRPTKPFSASFLATRLEPGRRMLFFKTAPSGEEHPLLELSQPHVATKLSVSRLLNIVEIQIDMHEEPSEFAISAADLISHRSARAEHELLAGEWRTNDLGRMQAYCGRGPSGSTLHLLFDVHSFRAGVWALRFDVRVAGVWGSLEDAEEGRMLAVLALDEAGEDGTDLVLAATNEIAPGDAVARLARLNSHFRRFWSTKCWDQQAWLAVYWSKLIQRVRGNELEFLPELLAMVTVQDPDDTRAGWVPKQCAGAELPQVFAASRTAYSRIPARDHPVSIALRAMLELKAALVEAFKQTLYQAAALAFENGAQVAQGRRPKGFVLTKYVQLLRQTPVEAHVLDDESILPRAGQLLGPLHVVHAWRDLDRRYETSLAMSSARKSFALSLANKLYQRHSRFVPTEAPGLRGQAPVIQLAPADSEAMDDSEQQRQEILVQIANACAWLAWHCRLEVRQPGALHDFLAGLGSMRREIEMPTNVRVEDCIAYYLHVAPAMFAYYLLLWELVISAERDPVVQHA